MSVEQLQTLSRAGYIASGGFLAITVLLFFILKIPRLIEDMTGVTARRAIEDIRRQNEGEGRSGTRAAVKRKGRGRHTDKMSSSGRLLYASGDKSGPMGAKKTGSPRLTETMSGGTSEETMVLMQEGVGEATTVLQNAMTQGMLLQEQSMAGNTVELSQLQVVQEQAKASVVVQVDIGFSESQETVD